MMVAANILYNRFAKEGRSSLATVRWCKLCGFKVVVRHGLRQGRGYGFREGNKARGTIVRHLHEKHADEIA